MLLKLVSTTSYLVCSYIDVTENRVKLIISISSSHPVAKLSLQINLLSERCMRKEKMMMH